MKLKLLAYPALLLALAGCGPHEAAGPSSANSRLSVPALPVIQDAVRSLYPTFNGKNVPALVQQLCALANGGVTAEQNKARLLALGINPAGLPASSPDAVTLLVNADTAGQATACAAYHAVSALKPIDPTDILRPSAGVSENIAKGDGALNGGRGAKGGNGTGSNSSVELDTLAAERLMALRVAQSRANADIFALIARRLATTPGLSESDYRNRAAKLFGELAPRYLDDLKQQIPPAGTRYRLDRLTPEQFAFSSDSGLRYVVSKVDGVSLSRDGQLWFGRGVMLGRTYYLPVSVH